MRRNRRRSRKPATPPLQTLAEAVLAGQRLRADETATLATFALGYAAKWAQAARRPR